MVSLASKRRGRVAAVATVVAVAAAVVALVLGLQVHHLDNQVSALQARSTLTGAEQAALADPSTQKVALVPGPGALPSGVNRKVTVVLTSRGRVRGRSRVVGAALGQDLPAVGSDRWSGHLPRPVGS